ncbi:hypothetical protein EJ06DRAFT_546212 [Trichodelitschia bisporula]|uniref:Uncharacterized protein n=1 Tax=Trichodelitschia bisporula TaxID=703511 RepID=A0A6G1I7V2_9PEZI|nr:hypothetical protein EJ06DRAFT_546212 [Trichodelitschia bisporula]
MMLLGRLTRNNLIALATALTLLLTIQLYRYSGSPAQGAQSSPKWKDWGMIADEPTETQHTPPIIEPPIEEKEKEKETEKPKCESAAMTNPIPALNITITVPKDMTFDPAGPRPDQIILLTASDGGGHNGGIANIMEHTADNRKEYCARHGYIYHFVNIAQFDIECAHPVWKKIPAIVDAFNTYPDAQWVFFLDLDAIIMSPERDLHSSLLSQKGMLQSLNLGAQFLGLESVRLGLHMDTEPDLANLDLLIAQDQNGINAGSFFLRRSHFTQWLLDMWVDPFFYRMDWFGQEQQTLLHLIEHHKTLRDHLGLIKQRVANAYPIGPEYMKWQEGDLLVHFAGCWVDSSCQERWAEFWNKRGRA